MRDMGYPDEMPHRVRLIFLLREILSLEAKPG